MFLSFKTGTGEVLASKSPVPSYPEVLLPQVQTIPSMSKAAPKQPPMSTSMISLWIWKSYCGVRNSPKTPVPQIKSFPSWDNAAEWCPTEIFQIYKSFKVCTCTGTELDFLFPIPSYPKLFPPIENTFPSLSKIIVWKIPHDTYYTSASSKATGLNKTYLKSLFPLPSWPVSPAPQVHTLLDFPCFAITAECLLPADT